MKRIVVAFLSILPLAFFLPSCAAQAHGLVYQSGLTVWILDPADLTKKELVRDAQFPIGLSHDLQRMAFSKDLHDLWIADIGGGGAKQVILDQLSSAGLSVSRIAWAPDSRNLAVWAVPDQNASRNPEKFALYMINVGAATVQLIDKGITAFEWTQNGRQLVVLRLFNPNKPAGIFLVEDDGSTWKQVYDGVPEPFLAVSPVKSRVAFVDAQSGNALPYTLFVLDPATGTRSDVLEKNSLPLTAPGFPTWSPDGEHLAFTAEVPYRNGVSITALFVVDIQTLAVTKLAEGITAPLAWSPDGRSIAAAGRVAPYGLFKINAETGEMSKLSDDQMVTPYSFEWR